MGKRGKERLWVWLADQSGDGCWEWPWDRFAKGYGRLNEDGRVWLTHRVAWAEANGRAVPEGLLVLHSCDNPPCCNPAHLFLGTHLDNVRDMDAKGRRVVVTKRGAKHPNAKLTEAQVDQIRQQAASGVAQRQLAASFGVSKGTIYNVLHSKRYVREAS